MKTKPKIQIDLVQVEALAQRGLTQQQIADALGISVSTLYKNKRENEEFVDAIKRGKAKGIAVATNKLFELMKEGNLGAVIFFLKTQGGWKETNITEIQGKNGGAVQVAPVLSPEQVDRLIEAETGKRIGKPDRANKGSGRKAISGDVHSKDSPRIPDGMGTQGNLQET